MKPYNSIIHSVLIIGLVLFCVYLAIELWSTEELLSRVIASMNPQKGEPKDFNETHVSILLTFIGVGFALFAFLTFQSVKDFFHSKISEIEKKHEKKDQEHDKQKHRLMDLISEFYDSEAVKNFELYVSHARNREYNWHVFHLLNGISYYAKKVAILKEMGDREDVIKAIVSLADEHLTTSLNILKGENSIENLRDSLIQDYIKDIRELDSIEIDKKVMLIYSKLV